jgi:hypothetical protein
MRHLRSWRGLRLKTPSEARIVPVLAVAAKKSNSAMATRRRGQHHLLDKKAASSKAAVAQLIVGGMTSSIAQNARGTVMNHNPMP